MPTEYYHNTQIEERLLGVSATGWRNLFDLMNWQTGSPEVIQFQKWMREVANEEADLYSEKLGVKRPLLVTCLKPEGTLSKVAGSSEGLHWEWAPYYIRRIQMSTTDALAKCLRDQDFPWHPTPYDLNNLVEKENSDLTVWDRIDLFEEMNTFEKQEIFEKSQAVLFSFPMKSTSGVSQGEVSAIEQLENVKSFSSYYTDHLPSSTITVKEDEWDSVANWVYSNWDSFVNAAFLSYWSGNHPLLPYEDITEDTYETLISSFDSQYRVGNSFVVNEDTVAFYENLALYSGSDIDDVELEGGCASSMCPVR